MHEPDAGGRNTQTKGSKAESLLEAGLSEVAAGVADLVATARAVDPAADEFGHARSRAYTDAIGLLKVSAKLGHTIAELRGCKFEHTIRVKREAAAAGEDDPGPAPDWDYRHYKGHDYDPSIRYADGKVFVHGLGRMHVPENWDEERWLAGLPQADEENAALPLAEGSNRNPEGGGTPSAISGGSNGNFAPSASGEARERSVR